MAHQQPNHAPEGCRTPLCGYLEQRAVGDERHDRCVHAIPMHTPCAWHRTPEQIAVISAQEQGSVARFREVFGRWGL